MKLKLKPLVWVEKKQLLEIEQLEEKQMSKADIDFINTYVDDGDWDYRAMLWNGHSVTVGKDTKTGDFIAIYDWVEGGDFIDRYVTLDYAKKACVEYVEDFINTSEHYEEYRSFMRVVEIVAE